jgi:hypothetical protein
MQYNEGKERRFIMKDMKDFWGNPALDFGTYNEMTKKYTDKVFASVTDKPFGDIYVMFVCEESEADKANAYLKEYGAKMRARGITAFGTGIHWGDTLQDRKMFNFQGGAIDGL